MDWNQFFFSADEKPLDRLMNGFCGGISNTAIFRTIGFVGDSLSSGEFESRNAEGKPGYHDYFEYSWGQYIARKNGLTARNFSRGGMTAKEYVESFADINRYWSPEMACQAYVIALGVNDLFGAGMPLGTMADIDPEDETKNAPTFAGYYARIIMKLKKIQPRAKFFLVSMPRWGTDDVALKKGHRDLLEEMAAYFGNAYVIDLFEYGPIHDEEFKKRFFLYGHMNAAGYIFMANQVDAYIDYIIRRQPEDFHLVPYIGTDLK